MRLMKSWVVYLLLIFMLHGCGETVPVACTPEEDECATENEGGFSTGAAAGVAAGVAIVAGLAGGGGSGGASSSGGSSGGGSDGGIVEPPGEGELPVGVFCGELTDADCQLDEVSKFDEVMFED